MRKLQTGFKERLAMKKFFATVVTLIILVTATAFANSGYVGNANSKKFHFADCSSVNKMNPANRVNFNSRDEAINAGYIPCKRCNP